MDGRQNYSKFVTGDVIIAVKLQIGLYREIYLLILSSENNDHIRILK
jgi:hypothetical protein